MYVTMGISQLKHQHYETCNYINFQLMYLQYCIPQVRGTAGEHTESVGGVYDISNKRRMGLTEFEAVKEMNDGIAELIKLERAA